MAGADGLDGGVEEEEEGADGDEDDEEGEDGEAGQQGGAAGCEAGVEGWEGGGGGFGGDGEGGVEDDGGVGGEVVALDGVEGGEGVDFGDAAGVVDGGAVVDDVGVEDFVFEAREGVDEDAVGVGHDGQEGAARVAEGVDGEELGARGRDRAAAEFVPELAVDAEHGRPHAQVGGRERREVDGLELVEPAFGVEEPDGVARHQPAERVADHAESLDLLPVSRELLERVLYLLRDSFAGDFDPVVSASRRQHALCADREEERAYVLCPSLDLGSRMWIPWSRYLSRSVVAM